MNGVLPRVLIVHNRYQQRGGEDAVVDDEARLLSKRGHPVEVYTRHNDEIGVASHVALAKQTMWSTRTTNDLGTLLGKFKPDVIHVHNTFPLISPSLYWAATHAGVPVVQTLHNFRLLCPQAMFLREEKVCEDCLGRVPWRGVARGCYRGSVAQTAVLASMLVLHRGMGTFACKITRFIALSEFSRRKFVEGGLPEKAIAVKANFVERPLSDANLARQGFLFVGRLAPEKGIAVMAAAMRQVPQAGLNVIGEGPDAVKLAGLDNVWVLGVRDSVAVQSAMLQSVALVLPSLCYENFPRTLVEAFAAGLPVIASRLGAMAELVDEGRTGLLFEPNNAADLALKLRWVLAHPNEARVMGENARREFESKFTPEVNYGQLIAIYQAAILQGGGGAV